MGEIFVVNRRSDWGNTKAKRVLIMRPSALGNPFPIGAKYTRETCIEAYRVWLWQKMQAVDERVMVALENIAGHIEDGFDVHLVCCCAPLACHGDVVKAAVEWMMAENAKARQA
ncbi:MAG: DUF4326 domain-containing protein [Desulfobacterales bacterium]|nr:DUF4326 domain-containing protein [Desulfobacterales bacterium]